MNRDYSNVYQDHDHVNSTQCRRCCSCLCVCEGGDVVVVFFSFLFYFCDWCLIGVFWGGGGEGDGGGDFANFLTNFQFPTLYSSPSSQ